MKTSQLQTDVREGKSEPIGIINQPSSGTQKLNALTGLRFVAAVMIVIHHSRGVLGFSKEFLGGVSLQCGVSFFFVLSGFILTHVYPSLNGPRAIRRFLIARIARIWPAHFFSFLLLLALGLASTPINTSIAAANIAMLHAWVPVSAWFFSFNAVSWSISTELFFYLAFPLLIAGFHQTWWWKGLLLGSVVFALVLTCERLRIPAFANAAPFEVNRAGLLYITPAARLAEFFLGMVAAKLWKHSAALFRMRMSVATLLESLSLGLSVWAIVVFSAKTTLEQTFGESWAAYLRHAGAAPAFALLIMVFASQRGLISRGFGSRPAVLLGEISFSIYLLHQIFLRWLLAHRTMFTGVSEGILYIGFCVVLLAASWLVWRGIERPTRRFLLQFAPAP
ncbi:MAG: acyltransferase 3 [Chthoniobacteraceae bacterium]|nr:acyltransferase 3 [Chthoniobacteraceae bacterium]